MATKYNDIYNCFKDKITDYDLPLYESNIQEEILLSILNQSCAKFQRICKNNLSLRDDTLKEFNDNLSQEEINILTDWMIETWLKPYLNNTENLRNQLSTKDFSYYSPANLLDKIQSSYTLAKKNARANMNEYSFVYSDIEKVRS